MREDRWSDGATGAPPDPSRAQLVLAVVTRCVTRVRRFDGRPTCQDQKVRYR